MGFASDYALIGAARVLCAIVGYEGACPCLLCWCLCAVAGTGTLDDLAVDRAFLVDGGCARVAGWARLLASVYALSVKGDEAG